MGLFKVACAGLLATVARSQVLQNCNGDTTPVTVASTEDAAALATSILECSNGEFAVEWVGEVLVEETFYVTGGTSLNITGAGPGAIADGGGRTQLFYVERGSSLHLSDMTMSSGSATDGGAIYASQSSVSFSGNVSFVSNSAIEGDGGAIYAYDSTVSWAGDGTQFISNFAGSDGVINNEIATMGRFATGDGGAIFAYNSTVSWDGDGTKFSSNIANGDGGAIYAYDSTASWAGDGTQFSKNYAYGAEMSRFSVLSNSSIADGDGGAIFAYNSTVSWDGNGTQFSSNNAGSDGGAIYASSSTVSWDGNGTQFSNNAGSDGGAIFADESTVSWAGNGTQFNNNYADSDGGTIYASSSKVSWEGDDTQFSDNSAGAYGGAIFAAESTVSWDDGEGTQFSDNSAGTDGGAIYASSSTVSWEGNGTRYLYGKWFINYSSWGTRFISNIAKHGSGGAIYAEKEHCHVFWAGDTLFYANVAVNGGAVALVDYDNDGVDFIGATFIDNSAAFGGALYMLKADGGFTFTNFTFYSNSASDAGGAVAVYGTDDLPVAFSRCNFSDNASNFAGGAVATQLGRHEFRDCRFERNSAGVGGALSLGGTDVVRDCSFFFNSASTRGLAIDMAVSANISGSMFDGNDLYCAIGKYRDDTLKGGHAERFKTVCSGFPDWNNCSGCSIGSDIAPVCKAPLEHTTADKGGVTLETLTIGKGYWRATAESDNILACYHADACRGGETGAYGYCAPGYKGPYCAVCETNYSPSLGHTCTWCSDSRQDTLAVAAVIAVLVALLAVVTIFKILVSTEVEEESIGFFRKRVLRAVPVQSLKIIVVVWQILTQFADAANVTYPGVYQDFLSAVDVVNFDLGSVLAAGCLWSDIDFHARLLVSTLGPLVVVGFLAMTYRIAVRRSGDAAVAEKIRHKHQTALLLLTFLVYSSVSSMVFQTFACETLDDGVEYLRADYRIHCTDASHKGFEAYAWAMVFVYPVGIPLLYAVLLFQRRDVLADAGADKSVAQPIAGLWEPYRPERFYYEVFECGRRILLTGVVVFIFPNTAAQIAITMLIAFIFTMVFEALSPYTSESDMWLSRGGHVIVFLSMFHLLLLKADVSGERDQSQAAVAKVLVVGHVLMILAIVFEVVGICYASRRSPTGPTRSVSGAVV